MFTHFPNQSGRDPEWFEPDGSAAQRWGFGLGMPLVALAVAIYLVYAGEVNLGSQRSSIRLTAFNSYVVALILLGVAVGTHFRFYWDHLVEKAWVAQLGQILGLLLCVAGLITLIVRIGVLGRN